MEEDRAQGGRGLWGFPKGGGARFALGYAALFLPFAVVAPYLQLLLKSRGFNKEQIGLIQGTMEVLAVLGAPLWGYLSDRLHRPRTVLLLVAAGAIPSFLLFGVTDNVVAAVGVAVLFGLFFKPLIPLTDGLTFHYLHARGGDYGPVRVGGSLAFLVTVGLMELLGVVGPRAAETILVAFAIAAALHVISILALPCPAAVSAHAAGDKPKPDLRRFVTRAFILFTFAAFLGRMAMMSYYHFFTLFVQEQLHFEFPGYLWMIGPLSEIPVIYFSGRIMRRIGIRSLFALGLAGIVVRLLGFAWATSIWHVVPLQFLHALTFGAYHTASVTYVSGLVPAHMKSSAQTLFSALTIGLGGICGGVVGGYLAEAYGFTVLYAAFGGIAALALVLLLAFVPRPDRPAGS